nr:uncharacterized mitochondrial protein AtMg00810-like [Tanacetum cinerariifolium]
VQNFEIQFLQEAAKFLRDFKSLAKEADESLDKHKSLELEIERLLKASVSHDIMSIVQNGFVDVPSDLQTELDWMSVTPHVDKPKLSVVTPNSKKLHASILSHSVPQPREFNVVKHRNVIAPGMFKINLSQTSWVDLVPNKQSSASIRINPITNSQCHVTFKENVSSDMVTASSTGEVKKNVTVEDYRRTLLLSKNQRTMSSECNNIKLAIRNDKSNIVYGTSKQCLVTANHDACLLSSVNALNSRANNLCANVPLVQIKRDIGHRTKDETPEVIKNLLKKICVRLQAPIIIVRTDNKTKFKNHVLKEYFDSVGITHETSNAKTPQQNGVVERRNHTLVEATRTIKLGAKGDIGFFIGYFANYVAYRVYNWRTNKIMETMNVTFDELSAMAFEQNSSRPGLQSMISRQISSELELTYALSTITPQRPSERDLDILFEPFYNEYLGGRLSEAPRTIPAAPTSNTPVSSHNADKQSQHPARQQRNLTPSPTVSAADNVLNAVFKGDLFVNPFATPSTDSVVSSTQYVDPSNMHTFYQPYPQGLVRTTRTRRPHLKGKTRNARIPFASKSSEVKKNVTVEEHRRTLFLSKNQKNMSSDCNNTKCAVQNDKSKIVCANCIIDLMLFTRRFDDDILVVQVYVDDIIFCSTDPRYATIFFDLMKSRFEMSMMGEMTFFLGLQVNQSPGGIFINHSNYVNEILKKYGLNTCDLIGTPMDIKDKLDLDHIGTPVDAMKYRSMIGALMYLMSSRPDIVYATYVCARYQAQPTENLLKEVKRIFRYLRGIVNMGLWYTKDYGFELIGFSDADYAGCKDTFKSTSGGAQILGEKLMSWSSKKQDCTSLSTAESEYVLLYACCAQVL